MKSKIRGGKGNRQGSILPAVLILITIVTIVSTTAVMALIRESRAIKRDYLELVAQTTASSGIELAKREMTAWEKESGRPEVEKLFFQYGRDHFPQIGKTRINCAVTVYPHQDRWFMESRSELTTGSEPRKVLMAKTVKTVVWVNGDTQNPEAVWRVSN